jgi:hypothetical protein
MDVARRNQLLQKLQGRSVGGLGPGPTVSLEDFFQGNDDLGSIGCNLISHPGVDVFHRTLATIRARPDVQDILVEIRDLVDEHSWPFSDTVFVLTSMHRDELANLVTKLQPDEVGQFPPGRIPSDLPALKPEMQTLGLWWD